MNITDAALKCVAFIGVMKDGRFQPRATGFFVDWLEDQISLTHLVTAEHVVAGLVRTNNDIFVRVNLMGDGVAEFQVDATEFRFHPDNAREAADVAVMPFRANALKDDQGNVVKIDTVSIALNQKDGLLPEEEFKRRHMGRGGQISIIGLFRSHFGQKRNVPIVRVGNISMLPGEPVSTLAGDIKAYLIEARSVGGLSGSPVFAHADQGFEFSNALSKRTVCLQPMALLGMVHGHFDVKNLNEDVVTEEDRLRDGVHTGIAIVIPVEKIVETINHPDLIELRRKERDLRGAGSDASS
ncbi:hypothetical protein ACE10Z_09935 [Bradyrhizobium sp. Pha-3]|uniref:hypothetical protein n=1 Tax=Bradyrhizobium sp. Pha-3 TaxID=208375 RepID=UPI0035D4309D